MKRDGSLALALLLAWPALAHVVGSDDLAINETLTIAGAARTKTLQGWDSAGRRTDLSFGSEHTVNYQYRADGLMTGAGGASATYADNGLLIGRASGIRTTDLSVRDGAGRLLQAVNAVNGSPVMIESLAWRGDGLLSSHTSQRSVFTNYESFAYAPWSRRLTNEVVYVGTGQAVTNGYLFDQGQAGGVGVLTRAGMASANPALTWIAPSGGLDGLNRVVNETNSVVQRTAWGTNNGTASVSVLLDGQPMPVTLLGTQALKWTASLQLTPGAHQLVASALHPFGSYTAWATNWFTNAAAPDHTDTSYDGNGNITQRVWRTGSNQVVKTQTLTWDAKNRLMKVSERDAQTNGFDWTAVYDGLGRRLRTTTVPVVSGTNLSSETTTLDQFYDPQVEFLEVGVGVNGTNCWKTYGPDLNGKYGGLQGVGGLEMIQSPTTTETVVGDVFGNVLGTVEGGWSPARLSAYGPVPGYSPLALSAGVSLSQAVGWRGKWLDPTGLYQIGQRPYDPGSRRFLSFDIYGHTATPDGYAFCNGDPVNYFDPDGRFGKSALTWASGIDLDSALPLAEQIQAHREGGGEYLHVTVPAFFDRLWDNSVVAMATPTSREALDQRAMGANSPTVQYYNGMAQSGQELLGSPLAQLGTYDWSSQDAYWAQGLADTTSFLAMLEGGRSTMNRVLVTDAEGTGARLALPAPSQVDYSWGALNTYREGGQMTAIEHINYRHAFDSGFSDVSRFAEGTSAGDIRGFVDQASRYGKVTPQGANGFRIEYNLGQTIGTGQAGEAASGIRVFIRNGQVQTAFPIAFP